MREAAKIVVLPELARVSCVPNVLRQRAQDDQRHGQTATIAAQARLRKPRAENCSGRAGQHRPTGQMVAKPWPRGTSLRADTLSGGRRRPKDPRRRHKETRPRQRLKEPPFGPLPRRQQWLRLPGPGHLAVNHHRTDQEPSARDGRRALVTIEEATWLWTAQSRRSIRPVFPWHQTRSAPASARLIPPLTSTRAWGTR